MANDLRSFQLQLDRAFAEKVEGRVTQVTRWVALEALRRVVMKTPVRDGRARGSWQVAVSVRPTGEVDILDKDGGPTIAEGSREIAQVGPNEVIFIASNLPYIERLEGGYSQQAPQGMVATTIAELQAFFASIPADRPIPNP